MLVKCEWLREHRICLLNVQWNESSDVDVFKVSNFSPTQFIFFIFEFFGFFCFVWLEQKVEHAGMVNTKWIKNFIYYLWERKFLFWSSRGKSFFIFFFANDLNFQGYLFRLRQFAYSASKLHVAFEI